jgi:hypothetical protein
MGDTPGYRSRHTGPASVQSRGSSTGILDLYPDAANLNIL